jgi:sugar-phosphatase
MFIAEEDVARRKPNLDGFQLVAQNLGNSVTALIVFDDSPSGLEAGRRAGCRMIAITATLKETLLEPKEWIEDFCAIQIEYDGVTRVFVLTVSSERPLDI